MSDIQLNNVVMYRSSMEDDNVAFDIIRKYLPRDYFRVGNLGMWFLHQDHSTLEIVGVDIYEP